MPSLSACFLVSIVALISSSLFYNLAFAETNVSYFDHTVRADFGSLSDESYHIRSVSVDQKSGNIYVCKPGCFGIDTTGARVDPDDGLLKGKYSLYDLLINPKNNLAYNIEPLEAEVIGEFGRRFFEKSTCELTYSSCDDPFFGHAVEDLQIEYFALDPAKNILFAVNPQGDTWFSLDFDDYSSSTHVIENAQIVGVDVNPATDRVYFYTFSGELISADSMTGQEISSVRLSDEINYFAQLAINPNSNHVFILTENELLVADGNDNSLITSFFVSPPKYSDILVNPITNKVYFTDDGRIIELDDNTYEMRDTGARGEQLAINYKINTVYSVEHLGYTPIPVEGMVGAIRVYAIEDTNPNSELNPQDESNSKNTDDKTEKNEYVNSNPQSTVKKDGGGCLIATAAYDSELSSQIQILREIRDNILFSTGSGTTFMEGFNEFYYTFSPAVADLERQHPLFKEVVKTAITPMLSTMSILSYAAIDSEQEILGYGIGVILLNIGMYFVAPVIIILKLRQKIRI